MNHHFEASALGKPSSFLSKYSPSLLFAIPRSECRNLISLFETVPFYGADLWTAYELSWLNSKGKPMVAIGEFSFPCMSRNIVESKSFKLYLNSLNQTKFESTEDVLHCMQKDLSSLVEADVKIKIVNLNEFNSQKFQMPESECLDNLDVFVDQYEINSEFLFIESDEVVAENLHTNLLKSNCPVTNQPDWATLFIHYVGKKINHVGLLKYIISLRNHNEFHEQCVERIYMDLWRLCMPKLLTVYACYTRRGGLDIAPFRTNSQVIPENSRFSRR